MKLPGNLGLKATSIKYISTGVAALGVLAFSAQADAADIYAPAAPAPFPVAAPLAPLWSGLYGGAHIGGAWADLRTHDLDNYWWQGPLPPVNPYDYGIRSTTQSPSGVFGGGTIGYNMQRGGVVFGIEADFGAMGLNSKKYLNAPILTPPVTETPVAHISTGFYGDVTGRLGWAWGPWLFYGKGGLAVLDAKMNVSDFGVSDLGRYAGYGTNDSTHIGWTAGGGVEYLWNPAWSVKVEYQFFDFGTSSSSLNTFLTDPPFTGENWAHGNFNHDLEINTVKVGLNYHLGCCDTALPPPLK
jgi:outer membrane immunogenic protein